MLLDSFENFLVRQIKIAEQLHYPKELIDRIKKSSTKSEVWMLMKEGRETYL